MFQADKKPILFNKELSGGIVTFNSRLKNMPLSKCKITIPISQTGSGTPSPVDNIRDFIPVSGVNVSRTGKNLYSNTDIVNETLIATRDVFLPIGTYTISADVVSDDTEYDDCLIYGITDSGNNVLLGYITRGVHQSLTFNTNKPINKLRFYASRTYAASLNHIFSFTNIQIELGNTATPYEPYTGNTYTISFGQTVYSANLDVLTGKLSITHELKTIDENSNISMGEEGVFAVDRFFDISVDTESVMCNIYQRSENQPSTISVMSDNPDYSFCCRRATGSSATRLYIKDTRFTSTEDFRTWLSTNPVKIAVKLAEPIEVVLEGHTIEAVKGVNNIFANIGTTTVGYVEVK